jgi:hypothetical protein
MRVGYGNYHDGIEVVKDLIVNRLKLIDYNQNYNIHKNKIKNPFEIVI